MVPSSASAAGTTIRWVNGSTITVTATSAVATFTSAQDGDWNTGATWTGGVVPSTGSNVTINHAVTLSAAPTNTPGNVTVSTGASLATSVTFTPSGSTTVNGTFQLNQGGFASTTTFTYGSSGTLVFANTSGSYGVNNDVYWPTTNGPVNVNVSGSGGVTMNVARTVTGTFQTSATVTNGNNLTLNGTTQLNAGGFFASSPTYGSSSTLVYNTAYTVSNEWTGSGVSAGQLRAAGSGQPANVTVQAGTLTLSSATRAVPGNLSITGGGLSLVSGGDLAVGGNWARSASTTFTHNNVGVWFSGATGTQTVTTSGGETFGFLLINKAAGSLQAGSNISVTATTGSPLQLLNAGGFDLNGFTLTLSGAGGSILASGGTRSITSATAATISVTGSKSVSSASSGVLVIGDNVNLSLTAGFDFGTGNLTTIGGGTSGTLTIGTGGFVSTNGPKYAAGSTLVYNSGGNYGRGLEWNSNGPSGTAGYPQNVRMSNNTALNYPNGGVGALGLGGTLTIDAGAALYMDFGSSGAGALTVAGGVVLNGNLSLGINVGGDLFVGGNWTNNTGASFNANSRAVAFNGAAAQTIGGTASTTFPFLTINNSSGTGATAGVTLAQPTTVTSQLTLTTGVLNSTSTNLLTVSATATTAISGGSSTTFVSGPVARALPSSLGAGSTYNFPVGKSGATAFYAPFALVDPITAAGANAVVQAEAFSGSTGGSGPGITLNTNRYWQSSITANSANFTSTTIRLTDTGIGTANVIASSATLAGTNYASIGGTVVSTSITSNTVTGGSYLPFLVMAQPTPTINVAPNTLTGFTYIVGNGPSASQTYSVSGTNLTPTSGNISLSTASTSFEFSTDNVTFGTAASLPYTGGTLASTTIYVRLKAALAAATYSAQTISHTGGGAPTSTVTCSGTVTTPTITITGTLAAFSTDEGTASTSQSFTASGSSLLGDIVVTPPAGFEVALSAGGPYSSTLNLTPTANTVPTTSIFVRIAASTTFGTYSGNVVLTSSGATTRNVAIPSSTVRPLAPTVQATAATVVGTGTTTATVTWTRGNGGSVIVLMKAGSAVDSNPVNNTSYSASSAFGTGTQIGTGNRVIFLGAGTSVAVTALTAGTTYHVAVYELNGTGSNVTFNTTSPAVANGPTITSAPSTPTFASVTSTGFTVNWGTVTGAASYRLDLSTDSGFSTFVSGYNDLSVATTSQAVTGLSANTTYFARVRAVNSASQASANSTSASQLTSNLSAPVAAAATLVTSTGFTANWSAVTGATDYRVDVYRGGTTDLIISEYLEGSGNNKYVEIYNGTSFTVDLSNYQLNLYANGASTPTNSNTLSGTLAPGATVVYANSGATAYGGASTVVTAANFNGDDAIALVKISTGAFVDIFGRIGEDPGTAWTSGSFTTLDKTLRRKSTVTGGVTSNPASGFPTLATEWDQFNIDTVTGLGSHTGPVATVDVANLSSSGATSVAITGLASGTTYFYVVRATSSTSTSPSSNSISVTTAAPTVALTGSPSPFTTTYGTASTEQSFGVSGSGLSTDATATAPTGYEVSSDNTTYGSTATFTQSSGSVSGTLYVRLAALTAPSVTLGTTVSLSSTGATTATLTVSGTVNPATPSVVVTGATTFTYNKTPQGPSGSSVTGVSGGIPPSGTVTFSYSGTGMTSYGPSATAPTDAGSYAATASIGSDANYTGASSSAYGFSIDPASLAITADAGQFKNKGASDPALTYGQSGLYGGDSLTGALVRNGGETPGVYPINLGTLSAGPNYNIGYTGANFAIAGPLGVADSTTKPTDSTAIKIPISSLLSNDTRVTPAGATVTSNLSLTSVTPGTGNGVSIGGAFVFFTPNPTVSSETFSYTLTDSTNSTTDTVTVTVTTATPDTNPFSINLVYAATATYDGMVTTKTVDFVAVPGQSIIVEYSTDMNTWFQANGGTPISTGTSGSFSATLSAAGDQTGTWNSTMFFRGRLP